MSTVLSIIQSLGINSTVWIQLGIFLVTFVILNGLVFTPYFRAHNERFRRTEGGKGEFGQLQQVIQTLQAEYERKARDVNDKVRLAFEKAKNQALSEQSKILNKARENSNGHLKFSREKLERELQLARQQMTQEVREIGVIIANKMIGADKSTNGREAHR